VVAVADSSKLGARAFRKICDIERVDVLVTDANASPAMIAAFTAAGAEVLSV
jgi:DeoR family transcriptional regulator of aga operon